VNPLISFTSNGVDQGLAIYESGGKVNFDFINQTVSTWRTTVGEDSLVTSAASMVPNVWTHLVFTFDGSNRAIYINGVLDTSQPGIRFEGYGSLLTIGQMPWAPQNTLLGTIDELKIYNRALSATDAAALYEGAVNVIISPRTPTLLTGQSQSFTAAVSGTTNTNVTWSLPDPGSGSITQAGAYTAPEILPAQGSTFRIQAQSQADLTQSDITWVTVNYTFAIAPQQLSLPANGTAAFQAFVAGQPASSSITWSIQESGGGTISASGVYTAPSQPGVYHVIATSAIYSQSESATIQVGSPLITGLGNGLVGYWSFDTPGNPAADASGNGNDGNLVNGPVTVPGKLGNGLAFNGNFAYVALPTVNSFTGPFTVSAWVNFSLVNTGVDNPILGFGIPSPNQGLQIAERGGKAFFSFYANDLGGNAFLVPNQWTHLAFVFDGQNRVSFRQACVKP
jgi:hypothetical protein